MFCRFVRRYLPSYATEELAGGRVRGWVERHVAHCAACSKELADYARMRDLIHEAQPTDVPPEGPSWELIRARIEERQAALAGRRAVPALRPVFAGAGALAVLGALVWLAWPRGIDVARQDDPVLPAPVRIENPYHKPVNIASDDGHRTTVTDKNPPPTDNAPRANRHKGTLRYARTGHRDVVPRNAYGVGPIPRVDIPVPRATTIAVELSRNSHTGAVEAAVVNKDEDSCVIDT
jgi:hypothetical protein